MYLVVYLWIFLTSNPIHVSYATLVGTIQQQNAYTPRDAPVELCATQGTERETELEGLTKNDYSCKLGLIDYKCKRIGGMQNGD